MLYTYDGLITQIPRAIDADDLAEAYTYDGLQVYPYEPVDPDFVVMTYNCGRWFDGNLYMPSAQQEPYYLMQNGMLITEAPDVICIQEYIDEWCRTYHASDMLAEHFTTVHEEVDGETLVEIGNYGRCIATNHLMADDYTVHRYPNSAEGEPDYRRYFDSVTITIQDRPVTFVNTHFNTSSTGRRQIEVNALIAYLQTLNTEFVVCGDFNTMYAKSKTDADYVIIQTMLNQGYHAANASIFGYFETYSNEPYNSWTGVLDNIFTSPNLKIVSAHMNTAKIDGITEGFVTTKIDHMPLIAGIKFIDA